MSVPAHRLHGLRSASCRASDGHQETFGIPLGYNALQRDDGIRVIGVPRSQTTRLTFSIQGRPWKEPSEEPATEGSLLANLRLSKPCGVATIAFIAADGEIGNEDEWYVECYTNDAVMQALVQATRRGVSRASVGVQHIKELYTTEHDMAPVSSEGQLFLRPRRSDAPTTT